MASWDVELAEPIALKRGGGRFRTLRDAATFLHDRYSTSRSGALSAAIRDLMDAAENPTPAAVQRATDQFAAFLSQEGLVEGRAPSASTGTDLEQRIRAMLLGKPLSPAAKAVRTVGRAASKKPAGGPRRG